MPYATNVSGIKLKILMLGMNYSFFTTFDLCFQNVQLRRHFVFRFSQSSVVPILRTFKSFVGAHTY